MRVSRIAYILAAVILVLGFSQYIRAHAPRPASDEVPKIIQFGLETYKSEGPEAAVKAWLKGGPLEGNKDALSQANILRQVQDFYGSYRSFEVIRMQDISASVRLVYLTLNYEKGPVFARFVLYRAEQGAMLTAFNLNAKAEEIVPNLL